MDFELILAKLDGIEELMREQNTLRKDMLTIKEAAWYLGMSVSNLYMLTSQRRIRHSCPGGKKLAFRRADLDAWLTGNTIEVAEDDTLQMQRYLQRKKRVAKVRPFTTKFSL